MKFLLGFLNFWYDFIVGDDWTVALAVVSALVVTALIARLEFSWVVLPVAVLGFLGVSLWRITRKTH
jgi:hypothetical protein